MNKQMNLKLILAVALLVLVLIAGGFWYMRFHRHTPERTISDIRQALEKHDMKTFERCVDVDSVLNSSYDGFVEGLIDAEIVMPDDAKTAVGDIVRMMKDPILTSFKNAIEQYVSTGKWTEDDGKDPTRITEASELLSRSGLTKTDFRNVESVTKTQDKNIAIANILVYQQEAGSEFTFEVVLTQNEDGQWRVTEIRNFRDFITMVSQARRAQLEKYMLTTAAITEKHERTVREAELKYGDILSSGSLGNQETRDAIKRLMTDVIQKDWEERKQELFTSEVPEAAQSLHHLRLRICDLHIEYAKGYAQWMADKKASTIRDADAKLKEAKTLEQEARVLTRRMDAMHKN